MLRPSRLFIFHSTLTTVETWQSVATCVPVVPACETSSNVPLYPRKRRKQQWAIPTTSCPIFPSLGVGLVATPEGGQRRCTAVQTECLPVWPGPCCRCRADTYSVQQAHSHLERFDSLLPCSCPDTQPPAASDFVTCRFHFSSVHHRKVFPGKRQWIPDPSLGRWRWPLRTTRHIHAQHSTATLCCREQKI